MKTGKKIVGISFLFTIILMAGCGQKGPLYLPDENPQKNTQQK